MHKVDVYLLKNTFYILVLGNLIALILHKLNLFMLINVIALSINLIVLLLIKLTIHRYAGEFGKTRQEVKDFLGKYIEDDTKEKLSFHDYIEKLLAGVPPRHS
jgi:hypothetical protein